MLCLIITNEKHVGRPQVSWGRRDGRGCSGRSIRDTCTPEAVVDGPPRIGRCHGYMLRVRGATIPGEVDEVGEGDANNRPYFDGRFIELGRVDRVLLRKPRGGDDARRGGYNAATSAISPMRVPLSTALATLMVVATVTRGPTTRAY